ncbi:hypothetical protein DSC45_20810 [Streptomyces sp. YIM 130001]|uniref:permease prefix domain 1-containing protein n=1 Tax=Streptomyces sp. YIM 130001 TaxID=2259644 RepID=UPI000EDD012F|nr:permease prefix domain 1-containing protein [Streptomyces sp. YIM 130001]RII14799.1 hypothetical protein DSC45_20810 [Streptomyces sp. YIM 130001]
MRRLRDARRAESAAESANPVEQHLASLADALHGPDGAKQRMLDDMRQGLLDTVAAHAASGVPYATAEARAVREFGSVTELAPACQQELTIAQARHTARAVTLTAPLLAVCWLLMRAAAGPGTFLPQVVQFFAVAAAAIVLLAAGVLAATGALARWLPTPDRLPRAVALGGTTASTVMAVTALTLAATAGLAAQWPLLLCAGALAAAVHASVASAARACRRCARLADRQVA